MIIIAYLEKDIIRVWEEKINQLNHQKSPRETFNLYIDNPFCSNQCLYCIHRGSFVGNYSDDFRKYYDEYLPKQIDKFSHIIENRTPDTLYFGGGSPNLVNHEMMNKLFNSIPDFKKIPNKVFESNPNMMNDKKMRILKESNFSYISLGIQSLKDRVLSHNNRGSYDEGHIKEIIKEFQSIGTRVNCDLMAFIGNGKMDTDIKRLEEDFHRLYSEFKPDTITIYPERHYLLKEESSGRGKEMIKLLRERLKKLKSYYGLNSFDSLNKEDVSPDDYLINYHLTQLSREEFKNIRQYVSSGVPNQPKSQNTLGLGGYANHKPYSYHGKDFAYITKNNKWSPIYLKV